MTNLDVHDAATPDALRPLLEHRIDVPDDYGSDPSAAGDATPSTGTPRPLRRLRSGTPGGGPLRLTLRASSFCQTADDLSGQQASALALREPYDPTGLGSIRELEVEVSPEALNDAMADALAASVTEAVQEAVNTAVTTAMDGASFDVRGNLATLVAVVGAVLLERGVWTTWDMVFGDDTLWANAGSAVVGCVILVVIRLLNLPLVSSIPGR
jgi:type IV secretory pathway VirB2 component (pilin)